MILDYPMLRDLAEHNRNQVMKSYAAGSAHTEVKPPRRRWWARLSHRTSTAPTPSLGRAAHEAH